MAEPSEEGTTGEGDVSSGPILLEEHYLIDPGTPLPDLDSPSAKAFSVEDRRDLGKKLFALVCTPGLPPRIDDMVAVRDFSIPGILPLIDWGITYWPQLNQRCLVVVYRRPMGGRVVDALAAQGAHISERDLQQKIIDPLVTAIGALHEQNIVHRAIRPRNLFYMDEDCADIVLGDYLTAPPGFDQPIMFETIERGMASPGGRGEGSIVDDLYAFGGTLALLLEPSNAVNVMGEDELIYSKITQGSYATLVGKARIPLSLLEPIRGLLADNEDRRWGMEELKLWISGKRQTPMQRKPAPKADTAFMFGEVEHTNVRTVSRAFSQNVPDAATAIKEGQISTWVRRSLKDPDTADVIDGIIEFARIHSSDMQGSDDVIVSRVCMVLDPGAPIRYKGLAFTIDGFGSTLAVEYLRQGNLQIPAEAVVAELPGYWLDYQHEPPLGSSDHKKIFRQLKGFISINEMGYGVERCLYELNPGLACQSHLVAEEYIDQIEDLLPALDAAANRVDTKMRPIDRHIAAYIAARFESDIYPHLKALGAEREETVLIGMLSLYAYLQWKLKIDPLLGLSSWIGGMLGPVINTYHNRNTRRDIEREIPRLVRKGSLPDLFDLIDNAEKRKEDTEGYTAARIEYANSEIEAAKIDDSEEASAENMERKGQQSAAMTSIVLTFVISTIIFFLKTW